MFKTPAIAIAAVVTASLLGAVGQYLVKAGTERSTAVWWGAFLSPWTLAGMGSYLLVLLLFTLAFRSGGTVVVLYPIYALTYVWAAVIGRVLFDQPIRPVHLFGMLLLVAGMMCMGAGHDLPPEGSPS
ncbi:MAG: hypothetical protein K0U98_24125 [Deltaproteobacteria bacterium]|nr:hypothetical protein [Deltaproteobacteria bacterium]